jgi:hypothetical protein
VVPFRYAANCMQPRAYTFQFMIIFVLTCNIQLASISHNYLGANANGDPEKLVRVSFNSLHVPTRSGRANVRVIYGQKFVLYMWDVVDNI